MVILLHWGQPTIHPCRRFQLPARDFRPVAVPFSSILKGPNQIRLRQRCAQPFPSKLRAFARMLMRKADKKSEIKEKPLFRRRARLWNQANEDKGIMPRRMPYCRPEKKKKSKRKNGLSCDVARSIHAVGVSALRRHGWSGDVGGHLDVINVAAKGLTMVTKGFAHQSSYATILLVTRFRKPMAVEELTPKQPPHQAWSPIGEQQPFRAE